MVAGGNSRTVVAGPLPLDWTRGVGVAESSSERRAWSALGRGSQPVKDANGVYHTWLDLGPDPVTGRRRRPHLRASTRSGLLNKALDAQSQVRFADELMGARAVETLGEWLPEWLRLEGSSRARYWAGQEGLVRRHVTIRYGRLRLSDLTPEMLQDVLDRIDNYATRSEVLELLSDSLDDAQRAGLVSTNPARRVLAVDTTMALLDEDDDAILDEADEGPRTVLVDDQ